MKKHISLNNKGFTLVELVIATVILSIIMVPLMRSFLIGLDVSVKSNSYGAVTASVENALEVVKNASVNSMEATLTEHFGTAPAFTPSGTDLVMGSYETTTDDGYKITVNVREPTSADGDKQTLIDFNDVDLSKYTSLDLTLVQPTGTNEPDERAMAACLREFNLVYTGLTLNDLTNWKRTIYIKLTPVLVRSYIDDEGESAKEVITNRSATADPTTTDVLDSAVQFDIDYLYTATYGGDTLSGKADAFQGTVLVGGDDLSAIQLAYFPCYNGVEESIQIDYSSGHLYDYEQLFFFVIKQERQECFKLCTSTSGFEHCTNCNSQHSSFPESNYRTSVVWDEGATTDNLSAGNTAMSFFTNLHENLYDPDSPNAASYFPLTYVGSTAAHSVSTSLVDMVIGSRVYIISVDVEDSNGKAVASMEIVKFA